MTDFKRALIVGAGSGLSAALARKFAAEGLEVALAARNIDKLAGLCRETGAVSFAVDAAEPEEVAGLFEAMDVSVGAPDVVVYNASFRVRGPFETLDATAVARTLAVTTYGAFLVAQQAVRRMLPQNHGAVLLTGASAGVKGYPQSAPFAMGKFGLRGLAQSMARELSPKGIHTAHFVIDGGIRSATRIDEQNNPDSLLDPAAIADTYWHVLNQPRSAWAWEVELRPWVERF